MPSFIASSYDLKEALNDIGTIPDNAKLFTADAVSMYTNISTYHAVNSLRHFLSDLQEFSFHFLAAINDATQLIMTNNVFQFGDCYFHQLEGTAMGTPPACCYATLYYSIKEKFLFNKYKDNIFFYKRYIDDVFGIWVPNNPTLSFSDFADDMNYNHLKWEVNPLSNTVVFLDLVLYIENNKIMTKMYEKILNLYLYISPHSAHPPGVLSGLVIGNILRIHHLCSTDKQRKEYYNQFFLRLRARGYTNTQLLRLFHKGFDLTKTKPMPSTKNKRLQRECNNNITQQRKENAILHLPYHPKNPKSQHLQSIFKNKFIQHNKSIAGFKRMTIACSRPKKLGEMLSYGKIGDFNCPPVSSFFD